ncbi:hypothetical protein AB0B78_31195 [Streptomyces sp. NPDC040724]|uniref:hypothetical protein n=1 Tax=Streptomyces sp. NPDC040724 TaxID=3155612 RepID=UPI0033DE5E3E
MTATRTRRLAPLLIVTLLAGGAASLSSTAFAAPTTTTASVTTDTDTDSPRTVKNITKKPRTIKTIHKNDNTVDYGGEVGRKGNGGVYDPEYGDFVGGGIFAGGGGDGGTNGAGSGRYNPLHPNRDPNGGAYGPDTCLQGYVWRESSDGDTFCVTPAERDAAKASR